MAIKLRNWLSSLQVRTQYIEPGSPWENGYRESFNGKLRDELLDGEIFMNMPEAQTLIAWRRDLYNQRRPHSSLDGKPPTPNTSFVCKAKQMVNLEKLNAAPLAATPPRMNGINLQFTLH